MCGSAFSRNGTLFAGDTHYNLYRSDDRGVNFRLVWNFPAQPDPASTTAGYVWTVFVDSQDRIFVSIPGTNRLYRSTDFGVTFTQVSDSGAAQNDGFYIGLTEDSSGNLYAATYSGSLPNPPVLKSTDGGDSWAVLRTFAAVHLHNVKFNPANGYLYVATGEWTQGANNAECERVFRSNDQGQTWTVIIDKTPPSDNYGDTIYLPILFQGNYVYLGTDQANRSNWIDRIYDDGSGSLFTPQRVYDFPADCNFPVLSGAWVNDTMVFSSTAEFYDGISRIVASQDGINWYVVKSTPILESQHHTNMLTSNPLGVAFYSDGVASTFKLSYPSEEQSPVSTLFSDGFESGNFDLWAGTGGYQTHNETVNMENPMTGSYSAKFTVNNQDGASYAYENVAISKKLVLTYTINANMLPASDPAELVLGGFYSVDTTEVLTPVIRNISGALYWGLNDGTYHFQSTPSNPSAGTNYKITIVLDKENSQAYLYVNDIARVSTSKTWTKSNYNFNVGVNAAYMVVGLGLIVYVDDVTVTDNIQVEPTPTPTPTASPTPTPTPSPTPIPSGPVIYTLNMAMTATIGEPTYQETTITKAIQAAWIASDGTLYAGSGSVLYKSLNQGVNWQSLKTFNGASDIASIYVNKYDQVFASPYTDAATTDLGLWRSLNAGQTWQKVLPLPADCTIWAIDEDSSGTLFAGVYTTGPTTGNARIYRSVNNGSSWDQVYYDSAGRHIHDIAVDRTTGYIYASVGDIYGDWQTAYIIRSTDGGNPNSWNKILSDMPQIVAIEAVPGARLFGTDTPQDINGKIYRSTDDSSYDVVLDTGSHSYGFWIRTNSLNGKIYASFVSGESSDRNAGIYTSTDDGFTWSLYRSFIVNAGYLGSSSASNFVAGTMYYSVKLDSGDQNGAKIYPQYGAGSMAMEYLTKELPIQLNFENATVDVSSDANVSVAPVQPDPVSGQVDGGIGYNASTVFGIDNMGLADSLPEKRKVDAYRALEIQVTF